MTHKQEDVSQGQETISDEEMAKRKEQKRTAGFWTVFLMSKILYFFFFFFALSRCNSLSVTI